MNVETLRLLARLHAVAAWIATATLIAAAWAALDERRRRAAAWIATAAAALALAAGGLGLAMHDGYRARLRQRLFIEAPALGWLFERKQHFAFGAVMLAVAGAALAVAGARAEKRGDAAARELRRGAALAGTAAAVLAVVASVASMVVARRASF